METYDVIIIGAGIVGTTIARHLSRYQLRTLLLDKEVDVAMGATKANSAIVHGGYAESYHTLKGRLCYPGRKQFAQLNEELNFGFNQKGSLVVTTDDDKDPLYQLLENGKKNGLTDLSIIGRDEIMELEPELTPKVKWALYCKGAGVCSPYDMAIAMAENAIHNGATLELEQEVVELAKDGHGVRVCTETQEYHGRFVINAAGVFADKIAAMLEVDNFQILPRTGEYILFTRGSGEALNTVVFGLPTSKGKGILLTGTYYDNLLIGPDASDSSKREDTSTHVARLIEIYEQASKLYPQINPKQFIRSFTGVRARSSTNDFIIDKTFVPGFLNVAGIQSPGLTAAPAIAELVADLLRSAGLRLVEDRQFDPYRKPIVTKKPLKPLKETKHLIDLPPSQERIICRCEQVTEGEILEALRREIPVKTIDGVKRRTRASMGYCQGSFCRSRIQEVMEREYRKPIDPAFDTEHSGVNRVGKSEFLDFLNREASRQK